MNLRTVSLTRVVGTDGSLSPCAVLPGCPGRTIRTSMVTTLGKAEKAAEFREQGGEMFRAG